MTQGDAFTFSISFPLRIRDFQQGSEHRQDSDGFFDAIGERFPGGGVIVLGAQRQLRHPAQRVQGVKILGDFSRDSLAARMTPGFLSGIQLKRGASRQYDV